MNPSRRNAYNEMVSICGSLRRLALQDDRRGDRVLEITVPCGLWRSILTSMPSECWGSVTTPYSKGRNKIRIAGVDVYEEQAPQGGPIHAYQKGLAHEGG